MKKLILCSLLFTMIHMSAQNPWGVAFKLNNHNFYKPNKTTNPGNAYDIQGGEIGFQKQLKSWLDLYIPVRIGSTDVYNSATDLKTSQSLLGLDVIGQLKYFKPTQILNPYLYAGLGAQNTRDKTDFGIPLGAGLNILLGEGLHLNVSYGLRNSLTDFRSSHQAAAGLVFGFGGKRGGDETMMETPMTKPMAPKMDNGKMKADLEAEWAAKMAALQADYDAKLASVRAECDGRVASEVAKANANCEARIKAMPVVTNTTVNTPIVNDIKVSEVVIMKEETSRVESRKEETRRVLDDAMRGVQFETGSSRILASSYGNLNNVVRIMKSNTGMNISVEGHTDNVGVETSNQSLSSSRAKACMDYIISKGIKASRLKSAGFGSTSPIAPNTTKEGKFRNRRVEFKPF